MADPIGSESLKSVQALNEALGALGAKIKTLEGMAANAEARVAQIDSAASRFNAGYQRMGGGVGLGGARAAGTSGEAAGRNVLRGELDAEAASRARLNKLMADSVAAENATTSAMARDIQVSAMASNELRARGALTTEFLTAAARGQTTLSELGAQAGLTAAKFGGWVAAAAAVYGVFDALKKVSEGVIETQGGIKELGRFFDVNPQQAASGFRQVSKELNVSVKDVVDAQQQFARLYHNENDSLTAARVAIIATKLDNLSAADSYRYITAAAQGFKLQAQELPNLIAMLNSEQNKLGARVSDTVPSFAKAAGAMRNAGGDAKELVAIIATLQRTTGQGTAVGTALQRFAGRQLQMPTARATIEQYGIDPNRSATQVLIDSVAKAQTLDRNQRQQLANALGGTQYGPRIFTPLLNQPDLLKQGLSAAGDKGNAALLQHEIDQVVAKSREGIKGIGYDFERIGSSLQSAGITQVFGHMLSLLNESLHIGEKFVGVFSGLPGPIKTTLSYLLLAMAAVKGLQTFNVLQRLPGFRSLPAVKNAAQDTQIGLALRNQRENAFGEYQRTSGALPRAERYAQMAAQREQAILAEFDKQGVIIEEGSAAEREVNAATARRVAAQNRIADLLLQQELLLGEMTATTEAQAAYAAGRKGGLRPQKAGEAAGILWAPTTVDRPTTEQPMPIGESAAAGATGTAALYGASTRVNLLKQEGAALEEVGAKAGRFTGLLPRIGTAFEGLAGTLSGFLLNPIFGPLLAYQLGESLKPAIKKLGLDTYTDTGYINRTTNATNARATNEQIARVLGLSGAAGRAFQNQIGNPENALPIPGGGASYGWGPPPIRGLPNGGHAPSYKLGEDILRGGASYLLTSGSTALPGLSSTQVGQTIDSTQALFHKGAITYKDAMHRLANALTDVNNTQRNPQDRAKLATAIGQAQTAIENEAATNSKDSKTLYERLNAMATKDLTGWLKGQQDLMKAAVAQGKDLNTYGGQLEGPATALRIAVQRMHDQPGNKDNIALLQEAEAALKDLYSNLAQQADDSVTLARGNLGQVQAAYAKQLSQISQSHGGRTGAVAYQQTLQKRYEQEAPLLEARTAIANANDANDIADTQRTIATTGTEIQMAIVAYGKGSKQVADLIKQQADGYKQLAQEQVTLTESQTTLAASLQPTAIGKDLANLSGAEKVYQQMKQSGRYTQAELNVQLGKINDARTSWAQQQRQDAQATADANFSLKEASTTDPVRQALLAWQQAKTDVRYADPNSPGAVTKARADAKQRYQDYLKSIWDQQGSTIDYLLQMGDISTSTAISRLEKLAQREKSNLQAYRATMLKIHQLQQQTDSGTQDELALGNIKLPTAYEVRRQLAAGRGGMAVHNEPHIQVYVNNAGDATAVFNAIDGALGTSVAQAGRAAGIR